MVERNFSDGLMAIRKIRIKQQKTERELLIPLHRDTVKALDAYDCNTS